MIAVVSCSASVQIITTSTGFALVIQTATLVVPTSNTAILLWRSSIVFLCDRLTAGLATIVVGLSSATLICLATSTTTAKILLHHTARLDAVSIAAAGRTRATATPVAAPMLLKIKSPKTMS